MNSEYATDTMALILRLEKRKLPRKIRNIFENTEKGNTRITIPAMVLAEIGYLSEKNKIDTNLDEVKDYCQKFPAAQTQPISAEIIHASFEIDDIPELHDRIIAGTARLKKLELLTNDPIIVASKFLVTAW